MKAFLVSILFLISLLNVSAQKTDYSRISDSFILAGDFTGGVKYFENEVQQKGKNAPLLAELSLCYVTLQEIDKANSIAEECLKLDPSCSDCYLAKAWILASGKDPSQAEKPLIEAIRLSPENARAYSLRGRLYTTTGNDAGAFYDLTKAIQLNPNRASYHYYKAQYNISKGYGVLAIGDLNRAIKLNDKNAEYFYLRSECYYNEREFGDALKDLENAIVLKPKSSQYYNKKGIILSDLEEWELSKNAYSKAIETNKENHEAYLNRSIAYYKLEEMDSSCIDIEFVSKKITNGSLVTEEMKSFIKENKKNHCDSSLSSYFYQRGIALYNQDKFNEAINIYNRGMNAFPNSVLTLIFKGNAYAALERYDSSKVYYGKVLVFKDRINEELIKNDSRAQSKAEIETVKLGLLTSAYFGIGQAEYYSKNFPAAIPLIDTSVFLTLKVNELIPAEYLLMRANIYLLSGEYEKARNEFQVLLQSDPQHTDASMGLAIAGLMIAGADNISLSVGRNGEIYFASIVPPGKAKFNNLQLAVNKSISVCDKAISLDSKSGYAHYVRGLLNYYSGVDTFCDDLLKSDSLEFQPVIEYLKLCNK